MTAFTIFVRIIIVRIETVLNKVCCIMHSCVFAPLFLQNSYSLSQNCWGTLLSSCPPKVGVNRSPERYKAELS